MDDHIGAGVRFQHGCICGGYAWRMNGRDPSDPHMDWCPQREEYLAWWKQTHSQESAPDA